MITAIVLLLVGLVLILLEFFVPGGVLGTAGVLIFVSGLVMFGVASPSIWLTIAVVAVSVVLLGFLVWYALYRIKHTKQDASIYLKTDQEGYKASEWHEEFVDRQGRVVADLKPAGHIEIDGKRYQAVSELGYLEVGTEVIVIGGEGAHLKVRKKD